MESRIEAVDSPVQNLELRSSLACIVAAYAWLIWKFGMRFNLALIVRLELAYAFSGLAYGVWLVACGSLEVAFVSHYFSCTAVIFCYCPAL
ncbi:unnamed protein product [Lathyrus oleraceus]